jgi:serine protease inhibitor ecotin
VRLEASTKPYVYNLIEFLINMAFTMACPNFKKGLKMVSEPLGVNFFYLYTVHNADEMEHYKNNIYRYNGPW